MTSLALVLLLGVLVTAVFGKTGEKGVIIDSVNNCRNVVQAIKIYASDEGGRHPDSAVPTARYSNAVFRQLVINRKVDNEKCFGSQISPFVPDGDLGDAPYYEKAVEAGENHWAIAKGLSDRAPPGAPLIFDNPVEVVGEPLWNADAAEAPRKGRTWSAGRVIVGRNDGSVALEQLASRTGAKVPLKSMGEDNKNLFAFYETLEDGTKLEVLNVETSAASDAREARANFLPQTKADRIISGVFLVLLVVVVVVIRKWRRVTAAGTGGGSSP